MDITMAMTSAKRGRFTKVREKMLLFGRSATCLRTVSRSFASISSRLMMRS